MLSKTLRCHDCGSHNHSGNEFCHKCGNVLYRRKEVKEDNYTDILYFKMF